jgi:hypothetical protein
LLRGTGGYVFPFPCFWERALPAADFDALLVRPSRRVFEAAEAALAEVVLLDPVWDSALPAADLDAWPVDLLVRVFDALDEALPLVVFLCAMVCLRGRGDGSTPEE